MLWRSWRSNRHQGVGNNKTTIPNDLWDLSYLATKVPSSFHNLTATFSQISKKYFIFVFLLPCYCWTLFGLCEMGCVYAATEQSHGSGWLNDDEYAAMTRVAFCYSSCTYTSPSLSFSFLPPSGCTCTSLFYYPYQLFFSLPFFLPFPLSILPYVRAVRLPPSLIAGGGGECLLRHWAIQSLQRTHH